MGTPWEKNIAHQTLEGGGSKCSGKHETPEEIKLLGKPREHWIQLSTMFFLLLLLSAGSEDSPEDEFSHPQHCQHSPHLNLSLDFWNPKLPAPLGTSFIVPFNISKFYIERYAEHFSAVFSSFNLWVSFIFVSPMSTSILIKYCKANQYWLCHFILFYLLYSPPCSLRLRAD